MSESNIFFLDPGQAPTAHITQIYSHLELFSDGAPQENTLFVLGRQSGAESAGPAPDRLLLIDPPADAMQRFRLEGDVALLFTGAPIDMGLPQVRTEAGGVAHIRVGDHFLDIYSQQGSDIVHFPALGVLCSGDFGSDVSLPRVVADGGAELETLRLLASLLKRQHFQLFVPRAGSTVDDKVAAMKRLAADVAYLNDLHRLITDGVAQGNAVETIKLQSRPLLPATRESAHCRTIHETNVETMIATIVD